MDDRSPLRGVRVVDFSSGGAGQLASALLADLGAHVVRVASPGAGHTSGGALADRHKEIAPLAEGGPKRREQLVSLVRWTDVLVETWEQPTFTHEQLRATNPRLVQCSVTGYGFGRRAASRPHEALVEASLGVFAEQIGHRKGPIYPGVHVAGFGAAHLGAIGILAALFAREGDGCGRFVETSLYDGGLAFLSMYWSLGDAGLVPLVGGARPAPMREWKDYRRRLINAAFCCGDGRWIAVHTGARGAYGRLLRALGLDDLADGGSEPQGPVPDVQARALAASMPDAFASRPREFWERVLREADVCAMPVLEPGEAFDDPQVRFNETLVETDLPGLGRVRHAGPPARFRLHPAAGQAPVRARSSIPLLAGLRVLDVGSYVAGPMASSWLGDLGASVVKLEPIDGDAMRAVPQPFNNANRNKRSIAADLKRPEGRAILDHLVTWADVVSHNMRPGAAERLGLGRDDVHAVRADAVYLYSPGWGSDGPNRDRQGFAPQFSAVAGLQSMAAGAGNPPVPPYGNEDIGNGLIGAVSALAALFARARRGEGAYVENPQINATLSLAPEVIRTADGSLAPFPRLDREQLGVSALDRLYRTADGVICLVAESDDEIGMAAHELETRLAGRPTEYWRAALPGNVVEVTDERRGTQFLSRRVDGAAGRVESFSHPTWTRVHQLAHLVRVPGLEPVRTRRAPLAGEHTREILQELGYGDANIAELEDGKVVRVAPAPVGDAGAPAGR